MATYVGDATNNAVSSGYNVIYGLDGNDVLYSDQSGFNYIEGGQGNDQIGILNGSTGFGNFYGGDGLDLLFGGPLPDQFDGGAGDDVILGGTGVGSGNPAIFTAIGLSGDDYIDGGSGRDALYGFDGNDVIYGGDGDDSGAINLAGGATLIAGGLYGGAGDDYLDGGNDNDTLNGGTGNDMMLGGRGNDTYEVTEAGDVVIETPNNAGGGIDTVYASINYNLPAYVENLVMLPGAIFGGGNDLDNSIYNNSASNGLWGNGGNDTFLFKPGDFSAGVFDYIHDFDKVGDNDSITFYGGFIPGTITAGQIGANVVISTTALQGAGGVVIENADLGTVLSHLFVV